MKRRDFSTGLALSTAALASTTLPAYAQGKKPEEGTDYLTLDKRALTEAPAGKIEVVEFFWYRCPHCNHFEPELNAWLKNLSKDVHFRRVPAAFQEAVFVPQQRLFYTLEAMGKVEELHSKVFTAIHAEKLNLDTPETITAWVEKQGVNKAKFLEVYNSFSVATKANKARQLQDAYKVDGVPALGVAGRYFTSGSLAQTMARALNVVDYLVAEVRKGK